MAKSGDNQKPTDDSFGAHLARLRNAAGLTLRQVEVATNEEVSMPNLEMKVMKSKKRNIQSKLSAKKVDNVGSNSRLIIILLTKRLISLTAYNPMKRIIKAEINFGE